MVTLKDNRVGETKLVNQLTHSALESYPLELLQNRPMLEMSYVFCLWKNPEFYNDYADINPHNDLITVDGQFFYGIGLTLKEKNVKVIDDASIHSFLKDNEELFEEFKRKNGYKAFQTMKRVISTENMESYYESLIKSNVVLQLYKKGFNVIDNLDKFNKMSISDIYAYFEYQLDNTFLNRGSGVQIEDFELDDAFLLSCDAGEEKGFDYGSTAPLLNYHTLGLHTANLLIYGGYSGTGKTSFCMNTYIMPLLDDDEDITIVANEMNIKAWKHIYLATILSQKLKYYGLTRKKQKTGGWTEEQWLWVRKAQQWAKDNYDKKIKFVKIFDYSIEDVKRIIKKQSKLGCRYFLYDTFKAENASSGNVTGDLIEASKQLLQVAEKEDVCIIVTMQLAIHTENQRFLTGGTLSNSKGVKEVVSELVLMRKLWDDEFTGEKYDVKPWKNARDKVTGKLTNNIEYFELDKSKRYRIVFLDKTRNDDDGLTLLYQFDGAWNSWKEIGYCNVSHINRM